MYAFSIGVLLDSFRTGWREALPKAAALGVKGIQAYATYGELAPEALSGEARREFLGAVKAEGLRMVSFRTGQGKVPGQRSVTLNCAADALIQR